MLSTGEVRSPKGATPVRKSDWADHWLLLATASVPTVVSLTTRFWMTGGRGGGGFGANCSYMIRNAPMPWLSLTGRWRARYPASSDTLVPSQMSVMLVTSAARGASLPKAILSRTPLYPLFALVAYLDGT